MMSKKKKAKRNVKYKCGKCVIKIVVVKHEKRKLKWRKMYKKIFNFVCESV